MSIEEQRLANGNYQSISVEEDQSTTTPVQTGSRGRLLLPFALLFIGAVALSAHHLGEMRSSSATSVADMQLGISMPNAEGLKEYAEYFLSGIDIPEMPKLPSDLSGWLELLPGWDSVRWPSSVETIVSISPSDVFPGTAYLDIEFEHGGLIYEFEGAALGKVVGGNLGASSWTGKMHFFDIDDVMKDTKPYVVLGGYDKAGIVVSFGGIDLDISDVGVAAATATGTGVGGYMGVKGTWSKHDPSCPQDKFPLQQCAKDCECKPGLACTERCAFGFCSGMVCQL